MLFFCRMLPGSFIYLFYFIFYFFCFFFVSPSTFAAVEGSDLAKGLCDWVKLGVIPKSCRCLCS